MSPTLITAALLTLALLIAAWALLDDQLRRKHKRPHCPRCRYDLTAHAHETLPITCPECGRTISRPKHLHKPRRRYLALIPALIIALAAYPAAHIPDIRARGYPAAFPRTLLIYAYPVLEPHSPMWSEIVNRMDELAEWQRQRLIDAAFDALPKDRSRRAAEWDRTHGLIILDALFEKYIDGTRLYEEAHRMIWFKAERRARLTQGEPLRAKVSLDDIIFWHNKPILVTIQPDIPGAAPWHLGDYSLKGYYNLNVPEFEHLTSPRTRLLSSDTNGDVHRSLTYTIDLATDTGWRRLGEGTWELTFERTSEPTILPVSKPDLKTAMEERPARLIRRQDRWGERSCLMVDRPSDADTHWKDATPTIAGTLEIVLDGNVIQEKPILWTPLKVFPHDRLFTSYFDLPEDLWLRAPSATSSTLRFTPDPDRALEDPTATHYWATPLEWPLVWTDTTTAP